MIKPLLVIDLDDTLLRQEKIGYFATLNLLEECCQEELIGFSYQKTLNHYHHNLLTNVFAYEEFLRRTIDLYRQAFQGLNKAAVRQAASRLAARLRLQVSPFVWDIFSRLKNSYFTLLISGSCEEIVEALAWQWGFMASAATKFLVDDQGCFTGQTRSVAENKLAYVKSLPIKFLPYETTGVAIGDALSDYDYLAAARYSIAYNPKIPLYQQLIRHGRPDQIVVREDLTGYYLESGSEIFDSLLPAKQ